MNIGEASILSKIPVKTIRYYEGIGLVKPARRRGNGYRDYDRTDIDALRLIRQARHVGFSICDCHNLLSLCHELKSGNSGATLAAARWMTELNRKEAELEDLCLVLKRMVRREPLEGKEPKAGFLQVLQRP